MATKSHALLVANNPVFSHWLVKSLGNGIDVEMLRPNMQAGLPDSTHAALLFVEIDAQEPHEGARLIDLLLERHPETPVFAVGESAPSDAVLAAVRAGARDYFVLDKDTESLTSRVGKVLRRSASGTAPRMAQLFPLISAKPDDALAFIAGHLALLTLEQTGSAERVLLIDMAQPTGTSLVYFNVSQTYQLTDALQDVYRCDQTLIDTAFARHSSGVFVLSLAEEGLGFPRLDASDLVALVETLRGFFSTIYLTADGHTPLQALCSIVAQATRPLIVSDQSILRSRSNKNLIRQLRMEDVPLDRAGLLVDRYQRRLGLDPENLSQLLGVPVAAKLGGSSTHRINAMNAGEPLLTLAPKDDFVSGARDLTQRLLGAGDGVLEPQETGLFSQLFS